jgi:hypothetical protein
LDSDHFDLKLDSEPTNRLLIILTLPCSMGYSLNQKGLFKDLLRDNKTKLKVTQGVRIAGRTEEEIFNVLGVKWR